MSYFINLKFLIKLCTYKANGLFVAGVTRRKSDMEMCPTLRHEVIGSNPNMNLGLDKVPVVFGYQ